MAWIIKSDVREAVRHLALRTRTRLRSGLLGGALAYALFLQYPQLFDDRTGLLLAVFFGSLAASFVSDTLRALFRPLAPSLAYYFHSIELEFLRSRGRMDAQDFNRFQGNLDERYFLGPCDEKDSPDAPPPRDDP